MALQFIDSFDHYATADITEKWTSTNGSPAIGAYGRRSSNGLQCNATAEFVLVGIDQLDAIIVGLAIYRTAFGGASGFLCFRDGVGGRTKVLVVVNADGSISAYRVNEQLVGPILTVAGTLLGSTAAGVLSAAVWAYVEVKVLIGNSGSVVIHVNGVEELDTGTVDIPRERERLGDVRDCGQRLRRRDVDR